MNIDYLGKTTSIKLDRCEVGTEVEFDDEKYAKPAFLFRCVKPTFDYRFIYAPALNLFNFNLVY